MKKDEGERSSKEESRPEEKGRKEPCEYLGSIPGKLIRRYMSLGHESDW